MLTDSDEYLVVEMQPRGHEKGFLQMGPFDPAKLAGLAKGVTVEGVDYGPIRASLDRQQGDNAWLTLSLAEGKNREIRRMLARLGHKVLHLKRTAIGPVLLGQMPRGKSRRMTLEELNALRRLVEKRSPGRHLEGEPQEHPAREVP